MGVDFLEHVVRIANAILDDDVIRLDLLARVRRMHQPRFDVLVIDHEQTVGRTASDWEEVHAVVVHANLLLLVEPGR